MYFEYLKDFLGEKTGYVYFQSVSTDESPHEIIWGAASKMHIRGC